MAKTSTSPEGTPPAASPPVEDTAPPKPKIVLAKPVKTEAPKAEPPNPMRIRRIKF